MVLSPKPQPFANANPAASSAREIPVCLSRGERHPPSIGVLISLFFVMGLGPIVAVVFVIRSLRGEGTKYETVLSRWKERTVLKVAAAGEGKITVGELALFTDMDMVQAEECLACLAENGSVDI